jgi:hypothetical protein
MQVVGGVVVFTVSAIVPIVLSRAALSLIISLMSPKNTAEAADTRTEQPAASSEPAIAH